MARNGVGTYVLPAGQPVVTGTTISSTTHNTLMTDIATALTTSLASDGQTTPTANIPMGGYKLTGLGNATLSTDALALGQMTASSGSASVGYIQSGTGAVARTVQERLQEKVSIADFGGVGDGVTVNTIAIDKALTKLAAGGTLTFPAGNFLTAGGHTLYQKVSIEGEGMGVSTITHTSATTVLFNMPLVGGNEATVEYGGNVISNISVVGTSAANTATAFKIKNKVNIKFDHVEIYNFGTLIAGVRDNAANSTNAVSFAACRFGACKTAIYAPLAWNGISITESTSFFSFTDWALVVYDSAGLFLDSSVTFTGDPTATGSGHIYLGGCSGWTIGSYHEGNPVAGYFISARSLKDKDGNATLGGIAIVSSRGGTLTSVNARSGSGTTYVVNLDGASGVVSTGCWGASGISTSFAYVTTGTRGNAFIGCYPNSGVVATFQTAADADYNLVQTVNTASIATTKAFPVAPVVVGGTSAGVSGGGTQTGYYCRIGDVCFITVSVNWTSHTGTGQIRINNLPFTSNANIHQTFAVRSAAANAGDTTQITGYIPQGTTQIRLEHYAAGTVTDVPMLASGNFIISGSYLL